jgi:hypothetical protein
MKNRLRHRYGMAVKQLAVIAPFNPANGYTNKRVETVPNNQEACCVCGKKVMPYKAEWATVVDGGKRFAMRGEEIDDRDPGYMGMFPVGPDCARKLVLVRVAIDPPMVPRGDSL